MDKQKSNLLDAYVRKAIALGKINTIDAKQSEIDSTKKITPVADDIDAIFTEVGKFTDYFDQKVEFFFSFYLSITLFTTQKENNC